MERISIGCSWTHMEDQALGWSDQIAVAQEKLMMEANRLGGRIQDVTLETHHDIATITAHMTQLVPRSHREDALAHYQATVHDPYTFTEAIANSYTVPSISYSTSPQVNVWTSADWTGTLPPLYQSYTFPVTAATANYTVTPTFVYDAGSAIWSPDLATITPEEADRRLAETRRQQHKHAVQRQKAVKKGKRLLVSLLNDLQRHEYAKHGRFTVVGEDGQIFVLRKSGTVHELGIDGKAAFSHCIHLPYSYIDEDTLISLKLLLENNVAEFRRIANTSAMHPQHAPNYLAA